MLPKANRLPSSFVSRVACYGQRTSGNTMNLSCQKNNLSLTRFAFIVPKGVDKRATVRNRIKRLLRESTRNYLHFITPGWDAVVSVRKGFQADVSYETLHHDLGNLFARSGIRTKNTT